MAKRLYKKNLDQAYSLSRTRVENFLKCPRCFYLQERFGINPPSMPGFSLNNAVDALLKKEFDIHRTKGEAHPLMNAYGVEAIPINHEELDLWRHNFTGIRYLHQPTNLELFGAIDDLWRNKAGEYCVVDYKATSTEKEISLDDEYKQGYKLQAEFYQWLLRQKGYNVSNVAYFVFCNGLKDKEAFDGKLEFDLSIIEYLGNDSWVEPTVIEIKKCLESDSVPQSSNNCELCNYVNLAKGKRNT